MLYIATSVSGILCQCHSTRDGTIIHTQICHYFSLIISSWYSQYNKSMKSRFYLLILLIGAGIYVTRGSPNQRYTTLANNGLIISDNDDHPYHFRFFCRSDSMIDNVGKLIGLDGSTAITSNSFFNIRNAQPGELEVTNTVDLQTLPSSEQGVYTCRIPLDSGELREINIGIYPSRFNSEL